MSTAIATKSESAIALPRPELIRVLGNSLYPGASRESIELALGYCEAAGLDPMQKPVHIVPVWDSKAGAMRDVIMPGVGLYRTNAARTGQFAGMGEPEFGDLVTRTFTNKAGESVEVEFPSWCRVTVKRELPSGAVAAFTAVERWLENYATDSGKSTAPNSMWRKRPHGQLAKCAQAQALRIAFPELGASPTAEEMEGKPLDPNAGEVIDMPPAPPADLLAAGRAMARDGVEAYRAWWASLTKDKRHLLQFEHDAFKVTAVAADEARKSAGQTNAEFVAALDQADPIDSRPSGFEEVEEGAPHEKGRR